MPRDLDRCPATVYYSWVTWWPIEEAQTLMGIAQIVATVLTGAVTITAVVLAVRAVLTITSVIRLGKPAPERFTDPRKRTATMLRETLGHTRMLKWSAIGAAHWFVMVSFMLLFLLVLEAYFEVVNPANSL